METVPLRPGGRTDRYARDTVLLRVRRRPDASGVTEVVADATDGGGVPLGIATARLPRDGRSGSLAVQLRAGAYGCGVAVVRRLGTEAARHGVRELRGSVPPAEGRELLLATPPPACHLLAVRDGRWQVVEHLTEEVQR